MSFIKIKNILAHVLHVVILAYALVLLYHTHFGGFDFSLLGVRIYVGDALRPYQILASAILLRAILYLAPNAGFVQVPWPLRRLYEVVDARRSAALLAFIVALSLSLRFWWMAQGAQDEIFYDDAIAFIWTVMHFLDGNYLYDTGYPNFFGHMTEFMARLILGLVDFLGFHPLEKSRTFINLCAIILNITYTLLIFMILYGIGSIIGRRDAAILAIFLMGMNITHLQASHYFIVDSHMSLWALLGVYVATLNLREEKTSYYVWAGVLLGLAFATKFNGLLSFIYCGVIYWRLHPTFKDFTANLEKPFKTLVAFAVIYFLANPLLFFDPWLKLENTVIKMWQLSTPRWIGHHGESHNTLMHHLKLLLTAYDYHLWAIGGLFYPVPLWLGAAAVAYTGYRHRASLAFLWFSPILFILVGRFVKTNAAPFHFMNLIPLLMLPVAIGILDALKLIPSRLARGGLLTILGLWCFYVAVEDTSIWSLPPSYKIQHDWLVENVEEQALPKVHAFKEMVDVERTSSQIREVYTGPEKWSYVLHRDARYYVFIKDSVPVLFPMAQFPSQRRVATIFPASQELATTERVFATGPEARLRQATRYVMAAETDGRIMVWVRNAALEDNVINLWLGKGCFQKKLKAGEAALFDAPVEGNRTFLLQGRYVKITATSEGDAAWVVAANHDQVGDLLQQTEDMKGALAEYSASGTAYGLLKVMALAPDEASRTAAAKTLQDKFPRLSQTMATIAPDEWTFESLAGYDDEIFKSKMTRVYRYNEFNIRNVARSGLTLKDPEAGIWGPYTPVMKGDYILGLKWMIHEKAPDSFLVDVATRRQPNNEIVKIFQAAEAQKGETTIAIGEEMAANFPFELMIGQAQGGPLGVMEVALTIDYFGGLKKLVLAAMDGAGMRAPQAN